MKSGRDYQEIGNLALPGNPKPPPQELRGALFGSKEPMGGGVLSSPQLESSSLYFRGPLGLHASGSHRLAGWTQSGDPELYGLTPSILTTRLAGLGKEYSVESDLGIAISSGF